MIVNFEYLIVLKKGGGVKIYFKIIIINIINMIYYLYKIKKKKIYNFQFVNLFDYSNIVFIIYFLYIKNKYFFQLKKII